MSKFNDILKKADFFEKLSSDDDNNLFADLIFGQKFAQQSQTPNFSAMKELQEPGALTDPKKIDSLKRLMVDFLKQKGTPVSIEKMQDRSSYYYYIAKTRDLLQKPSLTEQQMLDELMTLKYGF